MAANSPKSGAAAANDVENAAKDAGSRAGTRRSVEDLEADISKLRDDLSQLTSHLKETGGDSLRGARNVAEDLRAQGEAAIEGIREKSSDMQADLESKIREKPITALAVAAAVGYALAILTRR